MIKRLSELVGISDEKVQISGKEPKVVYMRSTTRYGSTCEESCDGSCEGAGSDYGSGCDRSGSCDHEQ